MLPPGGCQSTPSMRARLLKKPGGAPTMPCSRARTRATLVLALVLALLQAETRKQQTHNQLLLKLQPLPLRQRLLVEQLVRRA